MNEIITIHLFTGATLMFVSLLMKIWPPKTINSFYGYRTPRSMKSQEAWNEGNAYSANLLLRAGISTLILQVVCYCLIGGPTSVLIPLGYFVCFTLASIFLTEKRLKAKGF